MIDKLTPEQLKTVFDFSDTSDVTDADRRVAAKTFGCFPTSSHPRPASTVRLLKHYHPEFFVDPRLEAAKKLAREILAEEYENGGWDLDAKQTRRGLRDNYAAMKSTIRALLMDPPTGEGDDD